VNIVVGPNASGKTNLLEAILVLARGGSFRVKDVDLIQFNKPWARLDGYFGQQSRIVKIEPLTKSFLIDDKPYKRLSLEKNFPVVYFEPNHLQLIIRGPDQRRDYFDDLLDRSQPGFKSLSSSYKRTLAQRNSLLKRGHGQANQQLFAWNIRLSQLGSQIAEARQDLVDVINQTLSKNYTQISKRKAAVILEYDCQFPVSNYSSKMVSKLEANIDLEFDRGFTAYGPHREDFSFYLNSQPVSQTASRGESRSLILALKIFELDLIEKACDQKPLFLLDDVFSELDGARRKALVGSLKNHQTIITTTDAEAVIEYFDRSHKLVAL
jgi:DNA replication and repair protein RecF